MMKKTLNVTLGVWIYLLSDENSSSPNDSKQESKVRFAFSDYGPAVTVAGSIYVAPHPAGLSKRLRKRLRLSAYNSLQAALPCSSPAQWPLASVGVLWAFWPCLWLLDQIRCGSQTQEIKNHGPVLYSALKLLFGTVLSPQEPRYLCSFLGDDVMMARWGGNFAGNLKCSSAY